MMYFNEPMPNCVPEFYRSRQEDADRNYERHMADQERYAANRVKLDAAIAAGLPVLDYCGYGACCWECAHADHDTMTDVDDDLCRVICRNPACHHHREEGHGS